MLISMYGGSPSVGLTLKEQQLCEVAALMARLCGVLNDWEDK